MDTEREVPESATCENGGPQPLDHGAGGELLESGGKEEKGFV